jgi:hypothetical protein
MSTMRMIATHEVVERSYPRPPPTEPDLISMAVGKAIDGTLSYLGHQARMGRKPTSTAMRSYGEGLLDDALAESAVQVDPAAREQILTQLRAVLQAFRQSELFGLSRPRTRVIRINGRVGVYAQPDYWDGKGRFFEMKSYRAIPPRPEVALQLRLFQLAFPKFEAVLFCINRHSTPVATSSAVVPPPTPEEATETLQSCFRLGLEFGAEKVAEYVEGPFVDYRLPEVHP